MPPHIVKPDYAEGGLPLSELEAKKAAGKPVDIHAGAELDALRHAAKVAREVRHRRPKWPLHRTISDSAAVCRRSLVKVRRACRCWTSRAASCVLA